MTLFVHCPACDTKHSVEEVEPLNIEEDIQGQDVLTYRCIETDTLQKGLVYGS